MRMWPHSALAEQLFAVFPAKAGIQTGDINKGRWGKTTLTWNCGDPARFSHRLSLSPKMNRTEDPTRTAHAPRASAEVDGAVTACKDQLWAFAQQSPDHAILLLDIRSVVTWANPGAVEILGVSAAGIVGQTVERFFTREDVELGIPGQEIAIALSQGTAEDDRWMARGDGSRFWASGMMVALRDSEGELTGFVKILRDLTDLKMQMETLRNRTSALGEMEENRRRSVATLSHELRNPVAVLEMATSLLRKLADAEDARLQSPLGMLERNIGFVVRLLDDLDDATRVATGQLDLQIEPLVLRDLLQPAIEAARQRFGDRTLDIDLLLPANPIVLEADRLRLQQVFANLVGNAMKFTPEGERIWVNATVEGAQAVVRVEDTGIGIAPDKLEHIFEMFTQAHTLVADPGLGVGLAVVQSIVEMHGGSVQARSDGVGKGSSFTVRLPMRQTQRELVDDLHGTDV